MRLSPLFEESSTILLITGFIGSITALFAGTVGLVQNDLKRVIAFSTCSQIGYLFLAIGVGQFNTALFHLINHAIFKALLFLSAGVIIHSVGDNQDLRRIGGLLYYLPVAYISLVAGSLSLIALPYLTGFYSKELILELASIQYTIQGTYLYILGTLAAGITGFYSLRLMNLTFYSTPNSNSYTYSNVHNPDIYLILPLVILFIFSIILGY
jgi:NADH-ubiquinone oxidoreductase chain 5